MREALVFLAFALGGAVHSAAGFGSALVAMPILTILIAPPLAAPLMNSVGLLLAAAIWYQHRGRWPWRDSLPLILASLVGVPFGTYALVHLPERAVLAFLGCLLLAYSIFELRTGANNRNPEIAPARRDPICAGAAVAGLLAGVLGAAYAANGPPAIIYGRLRGWPRAEFKSVLQSLFLINGIATVIWQGSTGLFTRTVGWYAVFALPGLALGAAIGYRIDKRLNHEQFRVMTLVLIAALGAVMLVRAV